MNKNDVISYLEEDICDIMSHEIGCIGITHPEQLEENIDTFQKVLNTYTRKNAIHFVAKVNQCNTCMKKAIQKGCRIEVSSLGELEKSLLLGTIPDLITGSGPKNTQFLEKLIAIGATISVDSISELDQIISISRISHKKTRIIIRLSGFHASLPSRFGIDIIDIDTCISILRKGGEHLNILGVAFHIDTRGIENRQEIFWEAVDQIEKFHKNRINIGIIDIGGGYGVEYQNDLRKDNEVCIRRKGNGGRLYPEDSEAKGAEFLRQFLKKEHEKYGSISSFLGDSGITLWIEPGRSLLKDVGYVITKVISERRSLEGDALILDANSFALGMREEELPTNPYLLGNPKGERNHRYYLLGNLCLESDYIFSRKVGFPKRIETGDILVFPDLGGYHMDFYETTSILQPEKSRYFIQKTEEQYQLVQENSLLPI